LNQNPNNRVSSDHNAGEWGLTSNADCHHLQSTTPQPINSEGVHHMKAFVSIQDFGDADAIALLIQSLVAITSIPVSFNQPRCALLVCDVGQLGELFTALANNPATDWIEYTVQFG
jgi:hypothetical protein